MEIYTHSECMEHEVPPGHPERPQRLAAVLDRFRAEGLLDQLPVNTPRPAGDDDLARVHSRSHVEAVAQASPSTGLVRVETDTVMSTGSLNAARLATGA